MAGLTLRAYRPGDEVAINDGFNRVFAKNRTLAEWAWKFQPDGGRWIMLALADDRAVVAHYGAVPVRLKVGEREVRAGQICDAFTREEARSGLAAARPYLAVVREFFDRFGAPDRLSVLFGFPGERHRELGILRLGYDSMTPRPVKVWTRSAARAGRLFTGHRVREGLDPGAVDDLWRRSRARYPVAAVRDGAWFERRFAGRPGVGYVHLSAWRGGRIRAAAVVRPGEPNALWAELVWDGEDPRALAALDREVAVRARAAGQASVEMWLDGDQDAEAAFARLGWAAGSHPAGLMMVARSFDASVDVSDFPGRFYLSMGDSDLV